MSWLANGDKNAGTPMREALSKGLGKVTIHNQDFNPLVCISRAIYLSVSRNRHIWRKTLVSEVWPAPVCTTLSSLIGLDVTESASDPRFLLSLTPPVE